MFRTEHAFGHVIKGAAASHLVYPKHVPPRGGEGARRAGEGPSCTVLPVLPQVLLIACLRRGFLSWSEDEIQPFST